MEKGIFKELMKKYAAGHSTLEEEAFLIKNLTDKKSLETQWLRYVNGKKKIPAADLNAKVLEAINKKKKEPKPKACSWVYVHCCIPFTFTDFF